MRCFNVITGIATGFHMLGAASVTPNGIRMDLYMALVFGSDDRVRELVESDSSAVHHIDNDGLTIIHEAVRRNKAECVRLLVENGANVDQAANDGITPLSRAVDVGHVNVARLLIAKGANVNHAGIDGMTPLHKAVLYGDVDISRLLIEGGGDVNQVDLLGRTPFDIAASADYLEVGQLLILAGANTDRFNPNADDNAVRMSYLSIVKPIVRPLELIRAAAADQLNTSPIQAYNEVSEVLLTQYGISRMRSLILFAFESRLQGVDLFDDDLIVGSFAAAAENFELVTYRTIIENLADLGCTGLNVLYFFAPFMENANEKELWRLTRIVEFLTNPEGEIRIILSRAQDIALTGQAMNAIIRRASPGGPVSVVKALYRIYRVTMEVSRLQYSAIPIPEELIRRFVPGLLNPNA